MSYSLDCARALGLDPNAVSMSAYSPSVRAIVSAHPIVDTSDAATREAILSPAMVMRGRPDQRTSHPLLCALYEGVSRKTCAAALTKRCSLSL